MNRRILLGAAGTALVVAAAGTAAGLARQRQALAAQQAQIAGASSAALPRLDPRALDTVPPPVARYLRWALDGHHRPPPLVRIRQAGELRTDPAGGRWMRFEAEHLVAPAGVAFLWNARVRVAPLLHVGVRDAYNGGTGSGHVTLWSALPVAASGGTPAMNAGSLHRYLAEAVWYPWALWPRAALRWTALDDRRALATLTDHGTSVSLEFRFGAGGKVTGIYTPARWGQVDGGYEQRPWEGHFRDYERHDGVWVPRRGDVGWHVDGQWREVWRGTVIEYRAAVPEAGH